MMQIDLTQNERITLMSVRSSSSRSSIGDTQDRRQKYNASVRVGSAMKGRRLPSVANSLGEQEHEIPL